MSLYVRWGSGRSKMSPAPGRWLGAGRALLGGKGDAAAAGSGAGALTGPRASRSR